MSVTIEEAALQISSVFDDSLQVKDISELIPMAMEVVESYGSLTGSQKKEKVLKILDQLLDHMELPGNKNDILWFLPGIIDKLVDASKGIFNF